MADAGRLARPRVVFALLGALVVLTVLITPLGQVQRGALTSYSAAPGGARALYELARRVGWPVVRRTTPFVTALDSTAVYAVLEPSVTLTASEVHRLLDAVRAGARLVTVVQPGSGLTDSLQLRRSTGGAPVPRAPAAACPDSLNRPGLITWPGGRVLSYWLARYPSSAAVVFTRVVRDTTQAGWDEPDENEEPDPVPAGTRVTRPDEASPPAAVGFPFGRGRIVAVADADLLRNDVLRVCRWDAGVRAARMLEWLGASPSRTLVFDEYHHGYGTHADPLGAGTRALVATPAGRTVLQVALAALVLLAAAGARAIAPVPRLVVERRSPLEHVGALARAYERVGATRLSARRLVRGLRRRHAIGSARTGDDEAFLHAVAARHPAVAADARRLERALAEPAPPDDLAAVGDAVAHIDQELKPYR